MERFLERVSESKYNDRFILKGGMLVASIIGLDLRSTMDIDSTVKNLTLKEAEATEIINDIIESPINDSVKFEISKISEIMGEHDYPGMRFSLQGYFEGINQAIRIDLTTGDIITPEAVSHDYQLMFENRTIKLMTYNLETLLTEKLETMIARGTANTRMRDFYDIYILTKSEDYDLSILKEAIINTSKKRGTKSILLNHNQIMKDIAESQIMANSWNNFKRQSYFVGDISWEEIIKQCKLFSDKVFSD